MLSPIVQNLLNVGGKWSKFKCIITVFNVYESNQWMKELCHWQKLIKRFFLFSQIGLSPFIVLCVYISIYCVFIYCIYIPSICIEYNQLSYTLFLKVCSGEKNKHFVILLYSILQQWRNSFTPVILAHHERVVLPRSPTVTHTEKLKGEGRRGWGGGSTVQLTHKSLISDWFTFNQSSHHWPIVKWGWEGRQIQEGTDYVSGVSSQKKGWRRTFGGCEWSRPSPRLDRHLQSLRPRGRKRSRWRRWRHWLRTGTYWEGKRKEKEIRKGTKGWGRKGRREEGDAGRNEGMKKRIRNKQGNEEEGHEVTDTDCTMVWKTLQNIKTVLYDIWSGFEH